MDLGENRISFQVSRDGKVSYLPEATIQSTSYEMEAVLADVARETAPYIEKLLKQKLSKLGIK